MNRKKLVIIVALIIVVGMVVILTAGFNVDMMTKKHSQIKIEIGNEFDKKDIEDITKEVFDGQQVNIQKAEIYEDQVVISSNKITDEQKTNVVTKINEKYGKEISADDIEIVKISKVKLSDMVTPYIWSFILATILIIVYASIKYNKLGSLKVIVQMGLGIVICELLVFSIVAITRIPLGRNIIAIEFTTYAAAVLGITAYFENKLKKIKSEKNKKKE